MHAFRLSLILLALFLAASHLSSAQAQAVCKQKTAGYFKTVMAGAVPLGNARVPGMADRLSQGLGDPARGRDIVRDPLKGNCLACHRIPAFTDETNQGTIGPSLEGIGNRYTEQQLRQIIVDSRNIFPSAIMPAFYKSEGLDRVDPGQQGKTILTGQEIEDVIAFLKTIK